MKKLILLLVLTTTICHSQTSPLTDWDPLDKVGIRKALSYGYKEDLDKRQSVSNGNVMYVYTNYNSAIKFIETNSGIINEAVHFYTFGSSNQSDSEVVVLKSGADTRYNLRDSDWKTTTTDSKITRTYDSNDELGMIIEIVNGINKNKDTNAKSYYCYLRIYTNKGGGLVVKKEKIPAEDGLSDEYKEVEFQGEEETKLEIHAVNLKPSQLVGTWIQDSERTWILRANQTAKPWTNNTIHSWSVKGDMFKISLGGKTIHSGQIILFDQSAFMYIDESGKKHSMYRAEKH